MAKHARLKTKKSTRAIASTSILALACSPVVFMAGASFGASASSECTDLTSSGDKVTAKFLDNGVCELSFRSTSEVSVTIPSWATKLSTVLVGGGGGAQTGEGEGFDKTGGGGGMYASRDDLVASPGGQTLKVTVGAGGASAVLGSQGDGANTEVLTSSNVSLLVAKGGKAGTNSLGGDSWDAGFADDFAEGDADTVSSGTSGEGTMGGNGVEGVPIVFALDFFGAGSYLDTDLWQEESDILTGEDLLTFEFGTGGEVSTSALSLLDGSGAGGSVTSFGGGSSIDGADGIVIMRFSSPEVIFASNGAAGTMATQYPGGAENLNAVSFTRQGFSFAGWATNPDGTGTTYADEASVTFTGSQTLYAQWTQDAAITTCNINQASFEFDRAVASGALTTEISQPDANGDSVRNIGVGAEDGDYLHYFDVGTGCGNQIDARVTVTELLNQKSNEIDKIDDASGTAGRNVWLNTDAESAASGDSYVEYKIEFLTGLTYEAGSGSALTVENLIMTTYDIDDYQYIESTEFDRYVLSTDTILTATATDNGLARLAELNGVSTSISTDGLTKTRATLEYDAVSSLTVRLGQIASAADENAAYYMDFSTGESWSGLEASPVVNPASTPPAPTPYTGPLPVKLNTVCVSADGGSAVLAGQRLSGITAATVSGKAVIVSDASSTSVSLTFPALAAGTYDVTYTSNSGTITHQDSLKVCSTGNTAGGTEPDAPAVDQGEADSKFYVYKRFSNYLGDRGGVVSSDRAAITAFVNANPGLNYVTCLGSTSGRPAIASDEALALARAKNACSIVEELVPGVTTRLATITGAGSGQFFRAVTLFGRGFN